MKGAEEVTVVWGRRLASTETLFIWPDGFARDGASMGPSTRIDGDTPPEASQDSA